jgi:hypothetical protein
MEGYYQPWTCLCDGTSHNGILRGVEDFALSVCLPTRQDTQHLQRLGGVVMTEADAPVAHAEPPLIRGAL